MGGNSCRPGQEMPFVWSVAQSKTGIMVIGAHTRIHAETALNRHPQTLAAISAHRNLFRGTFYAFFLPENHTNPVPRKDAGIERGTERYNSI